MEKRKTFHGRQVGKKRLLPIVFPLFLFLLIPLNGYGDDTPMPEVVQQFYKNHRCSEGCLW